jgi:4-amino-4-deoxy-L-arabinose transferase-like glycosyltransferase
MKRLLRLVSKPAIGIFSFALIIRVAYNLTVARDYFPLHDSLTYQSIAYNLLREQCYCLLPHLPTVDRAPLWPIIIAIIYGSLGPHDHTVRLFLSVVGSVTCVLIYCFARDLYGKPIGIIAGISAAIYPFLYIYDGWLYSESLFTCLLQALCYTLYRLQYAPRRSLQLLSGLLIGLLSFTRPNGLAMLVLFLLWCFILGHVKVLQKRDVSRNVITTVLVALALIMPWSIRNYVVTHAFVPIAVGDGKVLLGAYNDMILQKPYYLGVWILPTISVPSVARQFPTDCAGPCEVQRDDTYRYYAEQWMLQHPQKMPYLLELHISNTWQTTTQEADLPINRFPARDTVRLVVIMMKILTPLVFFLAAWGLIVTRKRWRDFLFMYLLIALTLVQCVVLYGSARFRAPIEPMLILLAAGTIWWMSTRLKKYRRRRKTDTSPLAKVMVPANKSITNSIQSSHPP